MLAGPIGRQASSLNASAGTGPGAAAAGRAAAPHAGAPVRAMAARTPKARRSDGPAPGGPADRRRAALTCGGDRSVHRHQLDIELERGVGRDDRGPAVGAVAEAGRDRELALASHLHAGDPLVPALDDV